MREIKLDFFTNEINELHEYLMEKFQFPNYYGNNLDALYDCLTDICEDTMIEIIYDETESVHNRIVNVIKNACRENECIHIVKVEE